jgi:hypothetical protein
MGCAKMQQRVGCCSKAGTGKGQEGNEEQKGDEMRGKVQSTKESNKGVVNGHLKCKAYKHCMYCRCTRTSSNLTAPLTIVLL